MSEACPTCQRRCWLLGELGMALDYRAADRSRFTPLLGLDDHNLIDALAGRRREEVKARYDAFTPRAPRAEGEMETLCRHSPGYPPRLGDLPDAPWMLEVLGGRERLERLLGAPLVAIVGTRRPSDYGLE